MAEGIFMKRRMRPEPCRVRWAVCFVAALCAATCDAAARQIPDREEPAPAAADPVASSLQLLETGEFQQALERLRRAVADYHQQGEAAGEARALSALGEALRAVGNFEEALGTLQRAVELQRALGDRAELALGLDRSGRLYLDLGREELARASFEEEFALVRSRKDASGEARARVGLGEVYLETGEPAKAVEQFREALALAQSLKVPRIQIRALNALAYANVLLNDRDAASTAFLEALALSQTTGDVLGQTKTLRNLARLEGMRGRYDLALVRLQQALELQPPDDVVGRGETLAALGVMHRAAGHHESAAESLQQALAIWRKLGLATRAAVALHQIGRLDLAQGELEAAQSSIMQALEIWQKTDDRPGLAEAYEVLGEIVIAQNRLAEAQEFLERALSLWREIGDRRGEARVLVVLGALHSRLGNLARATDILQRALDLHRSFDDIAGILQALEALGNVYELKGDLATALALYKEAMALHEKQREETILEEVRSGLEQRSAVLFQRVVRLLMRRLQPSEAFEVSENSRARTLLEQLGTQSRVAAELTDARLGQLRSELDDLDKRLREEQAKPAEVRNGEKINSLSSELLSKQAEYESWVSRKRFLTKGLGGASPRSLQEIQSSLDSETTLVSYYSALDRLFAFVVTPEAFSSFELPKNEKIVLDLAEVFRDFSSLQEVESPSLKRLYDILIRPLRAHLHTPRVGIIPDGVLSYVPFAALTDGERFLGDQYSIFYLPSASMHEFVTSRKNSSQSSVVVLAASHVKGLPSLPSTETEARFIASLFKESRLLTGDRATEAALREFGGGSDILHIAAHAELNPVNPAFSRLLLVPGGGHDGALEVQEVSQLRLDKTDLVVLSASMTQITALGRGDEITGFSHAFLVAGVPSVVASLWRVDDRGTSLFMQAFYRYLREGMAKADALRAAQINLRKQSGFSHPYYWAAFVLTGDPGRSLPGKLRAPE